MNQYNVTPGITFNTNIVTPPAAIATSGIIHVVACTEKGPQPGIHEVISSVRRFRDIYGAEVTDGMSDVEKVLELGASVRIAWVPTANTPTDWVNAAIELSQYSDSYVLILSELLTKFPKDSDIFSIYQDVLKYAIGDSEETGWKPNKMLFVEIPKSLVTYGDISNYAKKLQPYIASPWTAIFAGGLKYVDQAGNIVEHSCLGTAAALSANSERRFGPWFHFSGANRGIVSTAVGIVADNMGSNLNHANLQSLATLGVNIFAIKSTRTEGRSVMLLHNFTTFPEKSSFRFMGVSRLLLYIDKHIGGVLQRYLGSPMITSTFDDIFSAVYPILEDLVQNQGIQKYDWRGDQFISSLENVEVNNLADLYNGIYRVKLTIQEVIALQEINIDITINTVSSNISIEVI